MRNLKSTDLSKILNLGYSINECSDYNELNDIALPMVQHILSADSSVYMHINKSSYGPRFTTGVAHGHPESEMLKWCERYQPQDPFVDNYMRHHKDLNRQVIVSDRIIDKREYLSSRFYQEFLEPISIYHVLVAGLTTNSGPSGILGFHRPMNAPAFTEREIAIAQMICPYFAAARERTRVIEKIDERDWIINCLAEENLNQNIMVLNHNLKPIYVSRTTHKLLANSPKNTMGWNKNKLIMPPEIVRYCNRIKKSDQLAKLENDPLKFQMKIGPDQQSFNIILRPITLNAGNLHIMVCIEKENIPKLPYERLKRHGLTPRQIDIAQLVGVGLTNSDIAEKLFISTRTVENHLRSIYEKTNVNNRTSLIYQLSNDIH